MSTETRTIEVDWKTWVTLNRDSAELAALEGGGVDNWGWYHESLKDHYEEPFPYEPGAREYED